MRVLIDTSYAERGPSGTQVYVERLIPELEALGVAVHTAARRDRGRGGGGPRSYANAAAELAWTQLELPRRARRAGADVLHHPLPALAARSRTPQVITVHDLAFELLPECFDRRFRAYAHHTHRFAARHARVVITPSERTADDVVAHWRVDRARIVVAPHGPGQEPPPDRRAPRHFLYVGDAEPRKNLVRLLAAYATYRADDAADAEPLELVLAGAAANAAGAEGVRHEPAPNLAALYGTAAALVIPSLHEGFGLPALEAMHAGCPVIASSAGALPEVCSDAARYVDPLDTGSIARAMHELATIPPLREELRRRGQARAEAFSWRRSAEAHLRAYALART